MRGNPMRGNAALAELLELAGLDGRGGAGFPTAAKVRRADERTRLIVNACDGELGSGKDAHVLRHHLPEVLDAVRLLRPARFQIAVHRGSPAQSQLAAHRLPVLDVPARSVSSEASALVALAHGHPARPLGQRFRSVDGGRDGHGRRFRPTLVLNAETMLRISQIHSHGPAWFRSFGTDAEPGPRLVTITGAVARPGVYETAAGTPLAALLAPAVPAPGPVLVGGLAGGWVPSELVAATTWSRQALARTGVAPGAGVLHVLPADECPWRYTAGLLCVAAGESAGQCGPCMFGLPALAEAAADVVRGDPTARSRLVALLGRVHGRGGCSFPDGVAALAASTLDVFADDLDAHVRGRCLAGCAAVVR